MFFKSFILFVVIYLIPSNYGLPSYENYENHKCNRDCSLSTQNLECVYDFTIEWFMVLSHDCLNCTINHSDCLRTKCISANGYRRPIRVVNRMLPGPKIQVCQNDQIIVNAHNMLNSFESTTIHWHGIKMNGTPHMDGVGMLTQCPITPHTSFQYKFIAHDRGTHMWHAHSSSQRADGLFGAIIVREPNDINSNLYDYDLSEHVIVVNDWTKEILLTKYQQFLYSEGDERIDGILINGRGAEISETKRKQRFHDGESTPRSSFNVQSGKRYRFRILNTGVQYCPLEFSIDEHNLTVISIDGNPIQPVIIKSFNILPGERLDFVLTANQDETKNYWIKVKGHADCEDSSMYQTAILRYNLSLNDLPEEEINYDNSGPDVEGLVLNPTNTKIEDDDPFIGMNDLRSSFDSESLTQVNTINGKVDRKIYLALDMNQVLNTDMYDRETFAEAEELDAVWASPQFNNISFHLPPTPLFYQQNKIPKNKFCNDADRQEACPSDSNEFCSCIHRYEINLNEVVELIIVDGGSQGENHPIHLHGQSYAVMGMDKLGESVLIEDIKDLDNQGKLKRNLINPPFKDTVQIPSGGYTIIRFKAQNPGHWFMHCHVEFHSESGMALVFKVGEDQDLPPQPKNWPQCGDYTNEIPAISTTTQAAILSDTHLNRTSLELLFGSLNEIIFMDLSNQNVVSIEPNTFNGLNLESLYLHSNKLSSIDSNAFKGLTKLKELSLHSNKLTTIQASLFNDLNELESLYLQNNKLTRIDATIFKGLFKLQKLLLESNQIVSFDKNALIGLTNIQSVCLANNPITIFATGIKDICLTSPKCVVHTTGTCDV